MLTTLATPAAIGLLAVTFGWIPADETPGVDSDSYEYLVKLSPEDLEALRSGDDRSLTSELPDGVHPISRVRVYVGQGDAPRRSTAQDSKSPRRIAEQQGPQRRRVAKPVTTEWGDAALIGEDSTESPAAERRQSFQNPSVFNDLPAELGDATERTRSAILQGLDELQTGTEDMLRRSGQELDRLNPYATRPPVSPSAATRYADPNYPAADNRTGTSPNRVAPPEYDQRLAQQPNRQSLPLREPASGGARPTNPSDLAPPLSSGPELPADRAREWQGTGRSAADPDTEEETLFNRFGDSTQTDYGPNQQRGVSPIPRNRVPASRAGDDGWNDRRRIDDDAEYQRYLAELRDDEEAARQRREARQPISAPDQFAELPTRRGEPLGDETPTNVSNPSDKATLGGSGWTGSFDEPADKGSSAVIPPGSENGVSRNNDLQTILLVFALFGAGYVWVTHMELRAKYRALLRSSSGAGYTAAA